jgi:predicted  nucleic acid-binding Zn-ribbon protein
MKDFIAKLQKDLNNLQKTLKKEGDDLVTIVKKTATKENLVTKGKELEKLVNMKLKEFEPQINRFMTDVRKNAKKAGIDIDVLEQQLRSKLSTTAGKAKSAAGKARSAASKAKGAVKKKAPTKKASSRKATAKPQKTAEASAKPVAATVVSAE